MHILFTDETNTVETENVKFFVYGGLMFPIDSLAKLDGDIRIIRATNGYKPSDELKFATFCRPKHVSQEKANLAKEAVIDACIKRGCRFIALVVLHAIAKSQTKDTLIKWGASHVLGRFNYFLTQMNDWGIVVVDRLPIVGDYRYLTEKFCEGLEFDDGSRVALDHIKLYASTCSNASHASSAMDIVLGCFRYCINNPQNVDLAKKLMAKVTQLMWHERHGDQIIALERGLVFRPKNVIVQEYKLEYQKLVEHINSLIADAEF